MTKDEKISAIIEASKLYHINDIDRIGHGNGVRKMLAGNRVTEKKLDYMMENIERLRRQEGSTCEVEKPQETSQTQAENKQLEQRESKVEQNKVEPLNTVAKEINPKVNPREFFAILEKKDTDQIEQNENKVKQNNNDLSMLEKIQSLENALAQRDSRISALEDRLNKVEQDREQRSIGQPNHEHKASDDSPRIHGFRLVQKKTYTRWQEQQLCYVKWYAVKGKKVVYLGADPQDAENKIKAYCQRRGFHLESKVMA